MITPTESRKETITLYVSERKDGKYEVSSWKGSCSCTGCTLPMSKDEALELAQITKETLEKEGKEVIAWLKERVREDD